MKSLKGKIICAVVIVIVAILAVAGGMYYKETHTHVHTVGYKYESNGDGTHNKISYCTDEDGLECKDFESETVVEDCDLDESGICKVCGWFKIEEEEAKTEPTGTLTGSSDDTKSSSKSVASSGGSGSSNNNSNSNNSPETNESIEDNSNSAYDPTYVDRQIEAEQNAAANELGWTFITPEEANQNLNNASVIEYDENGNPKTCITKVN